MRKCLRCGTEMKEDCTRIGKPKVAICPKCGEVSIYIEDVDKLK